MIKGHLWGDVWKCLRRVSGSTGKTAAAESKSDLPAPVTVWLHCRREYPDGWVIQGAYASPIRLDWLTIGDAVVRYEPKEIKVLRDLTPTWEVGDAGDPGFVVADPSGDS